MVQNRDYDRPLAGRKGLPDTTGDSQPKDGPAKLRMASGGPKGATKTSPQGQHSQCGPSVESMVGKGNHKVQKPGV